jgi:RNA polymerase sigma-70 factor (ECF subfamily)
MEYHHGDPNANAHVSHACLNALSDEDLIEKLAGGCHDSLAVLFDRYYRLVLGIAATVLRDSVEAEDVLQAVFLEIYRVAGLFDRSKGKAKAWLIRYAYHRSLDRRRQLKLRGFYDSADGKEMERRTAKHTTGVPWKGWNSFELSRMLEEGFEALTPDQRTTLHLVFFEGRSMREIAERLGATFANVRHHYYRGLQKLRLFMTEQTASSQDEGPSEKGSPYVES